MRTRGHRSWRTGAISVVATLMLAAAPAPTAQAADEVGVARMQACSPTSADFASIEVAPEVSGTLPLQAGMHRLWDLGVTWKDVHPAPGSFTWTALDAQISKAEAAGARPLLVLGMTPAWAAANPNAGDPRWGLGTASPPRDINDWRAYVSAVVDRYGSRIAGYEVWNEANLATFWTGTPDQMADLTAAAYEIIKAKQPGAVVLLPSVTLRLRPSMRRFMSPFLVALGTRGNPFDAFAIHTYPAGNLGPQDRVNDIVYWQSTVVNQVGSASPILDRPIFDTEVNFGLAGPGSTSGRAYSDAEGAALIKQAYLDSRNLGIDATFWYLYTAAPYPLLGVQLWQGAPAALDAWRTIRRVFAAGTPCPTAGSADPFEVDRLLAPTAVPSPIQSGRASILDNGQPVTSTAPPAITGPSLTVGEVAWALTLRAPTVRTSAPFGAPTSGSIAIQGSGYAPGSTVYAWLISPATFLVSTRADAGGGFNATVTIPSDATTGLNAVQVNGFLPTGAVRSASIGTAVFGSTSSPVRTAVTFSAGKRRLDGTARTSLRDLVAGLPTASGIRTVVTGYRSEEGPRRKARALARKRANKVAAFLRDSGLKGTITVVLAPANAPTQANAVGVQVTWP